MFAVLLSIFTTIIFWLYFRKKTNVFQNIMLGFYLIILMGSIGCIFYDVYPWYVSSLNLMVFTVLTLYCVWSFEGMKLDMNRVINYQNEVGIGWFFYIYIIGVVVYMFVFIPKCMETIETGSFLAAYQEMRDDSISRFDSSSQKWLYYFVSRLHYLALIIGFNYLCKRHAIKGATIIIAAISSIMVWAVYIVSRTDIFQIIVITFTLYTLYRKYIPKKTLRRINIALITAAAIIVAVNVLITLSRIEYKTDNLWVFNYFGRSVLTFNSIMEYPAAMKDGVYFLGTQTVFSINHPSYGGHEFVPVFARMYMDYGWFGFVVFLFLPIIIPKRRIALPEFYVILWIFNTMLLGIMYSNFTISEIVFALLIFTALKLYFISPSKSWQNATKRRNLIKQERI